MSGGHMTKKPWHGTLITPEIYGRYLAYLLAGDKAACRKVILALLEKKMDVKELYSCLLQESMYEVGEKWEKKEITTATEHLATSITENLITMIYMRVTPKRPCRNEIVVACCQNELHSLGARIISDFFELHGWKSYFLGANVPEKDLLTFIMHFACPVVGLSFTTAENADNFLRTVDSISQKIKTVKVIAGGQGLKMISDKISFLSERKVSLLFTLDEAEKFIIATSEHINVQ